MVHPDHRYGSHRCQRRRRRRCRRRRCQSCISLTTWAAHQPPGRRQIILPTPQRPSQQQRLPLAGPKAASPPVYKDSTTAPSDPKTTSDASSPTPTTAPVSTPVSTSAAPTAKSYPANRNTRWDRAWESTREISFVRDPQLLFYSWITPRQQQHRQIIPPTPTYL